MRNRVRAFGATAIVLVLVQGCGGGGGGSAAVTTPPPANLQSAPGLAALTTYLQAPHQNTLTATDSAGNSYVLQLTRTPTSGTTTFNGVGNASSEVDVVNLSKNGVAVASSSTTSYYVLSPYLPLGSAPSSGSGPVGIVSAPATLPATFTVGSSGPVDTLTFYHDASLSIVDATETVAFSVTANNPTTLLLCLNSTIANVTSQGTADGLAADSESDCYTEDSAGSIILDDVKVTVGATTLTFR